MHILLENDSWYRRYLVEADGDPSEEAAGTAEESGETTEEGEGSSDSGAESSDEAAEEPEEASDTETREALENLSAAEFAEKYRLMQDNMRGPYAEPKLVSGGFLDILHNLGAAVWNKVQKARAPKADQEKYGAAAGFKLNTDGIEKFKEAWIKAHYKNLPQAVRAAIYNRVDENFTPDQSSLAQYLENLRDSDFNLEGLNREFALVLCNLVDQGDKTFGNLVRDPSSLLYNKGLYEGGNPTFSLKSVVFLSKPETQRRLQAAGDFSLVDFMDGDLLMPASDIKQLISELDQKLKAAGGASKGKRDLTLRDWLASQKVSQASVDGILAALAKAVGGDLQSKLTITPKQYEGYVRLLKEEPSVKTAFLNSPLRMRSEGDGESPDVAKLFASQLKALPSDVKKELGIRDSGSSSAKRTRPTLLSFLEGRRVKAADRKNVLNGWVEAESGLKESAKSAVRKMLEYYSRDPRSFAKMLGTIELPSASQQEAIRQLVRAANNFQKSVQIDNELTVRQYLQEKGYTDNATMVRRLLELTRGNDTASRYVGRNTDSPSRLLNLPISAASDEAVLAALQKAASAS